VLVDPSHATGRRDLVAPLAAAAIAAGAHGVIVETHPDAGTAVSDGPQALNPAELLDLGRRLGAKR
jgi:3-deoxy-7-phosphoheptulonate synthase